MNLFLPFCIVKTFSEDILCRHLRPNPGLGEQCHVPSLLEGRPMQSPASFTLSGVTTLATAAEMWLNCEGKNTVMLLSVLADKKDEQN